MFLGNWSLRSPSHVQENTSLSLCFLTPPWLFKIFFLYHCLSYDCAQTTVKPTILRGKGRKTDKTVIQKQAGKWSHVVVPFVGGMHSSFVDSESLLSPWRVTEAHQACVWKPFPVLREDSDPDGAPFTCGCFHQGCAVYCSPSWRFEPCPVHGAVLGGIGAPKEMSPTYTQEYKKEKCLLEKTDHISFRKESRSCPNLLVEW